MIVDNMKESVDFFSDVLGFKIDSIYDPKPGTTITLMQGNGGAMVELIEDPQFKTGLYSVGMEVDDMDKAMAELKVKGAKILAEPMPTLVGSCAFIEAPGRIRIAIIHHDP